MSEWDEFDALRCKYIPSERYGLGNLWFYLTDRCNLRCRHCWISPEWSEEIVQSEITVADVERLLDEGQPLGVTQAKLSGGEPLLHREFIYIVRTLARRGIKVGLETNGTLIDHEIAGVLGECSVGVGVSLDSPYPQRHDRFRGVSGAFDAAIAGLKRLKAAGRNPSITMAIYRDNVGEIDAMCQLLSDLGITFLKLNPVTSIGRGANMKKAGKLLSATEVIALFGRTDDFKRRYGVRVMVSLPMACQPLGEMLREGVSFCTFLGLLSILANGDVSFCGYGTVDPKWGLGNINDPDFSLSRIWREHPLVLETRSIVRWKLEGICSRCIHVRYCAGQCRATAVQAYGSLTAPDPICTELADAGLFPKDRLVPEAIDRHKVWLDIARDEAEALDNPPG